MGQCTVAVTGSLLFTEFGFLISNSELKWQKQEVQSQSLVFTIFKKESMDGKT